MEQVIGINKENLKKLILKVYEYRDKMNALLNEVQLLVDDSSKYYKSEDGECYRKKINEFLSNKQTLLGNIKSTGEDLTQVLNKFDKKQLDIVDIFKK